MERLKHYTSVFGSGLLKQMAPEIAGGMLNELFHKWDVDVDKIVTDVQRDRSIWDDLQPDQRKHLMNLANRIGNLDFITPNMVIESIKKDFPAVASLFLSWDEAQEWLCRQIDHLKQEAQNSSPAG